MEQARIRDVVVTMFPYTLEYVEGQSAPEGYVALHVPGTMPIWVEKDLAARVIALIDHNKLREARTMILWFGGEKEPS